MSNFNTKVTLFIMIIFGVVNNGISQATNATP